MKLERFNTLGNTEQNEAFDWEKYQSFDWENYDDTDLAGPSWGARCKDLVEEFADVLGNVIGGDTAMDKMRRKHALIALGTLFQQELDEARKNV
jgi:hypothetical protein